MTPLRFGRPQIHASRRFCRLASAIDGTESVHRPPDRH